LGQVVSSASAKIQNLNLFPSMCTSFSPSSPSAAPTRVPGPVHQSHSVCTSRYSVCINFPPPSLQRPVTRRAGLRPAGRAGPWCAGAAGVVPRGVGRHGREAKRRWSHVKSGFIFPILSYICSYVHYINSQRSLQGHAGSFIRCDGTFGEVMWKGSVGVHDCGGTLRKKVSGRHPQPSCGLPAASSAGPPLARWRGPVARAGCWKVLAGVCA
jgi:hypothetical protein